MTPRLGVALHDVSVRRGTTWALRDVTLRLPAGTRWALIGGNGAGKTQLLKLIAADVWPTPTGRERRVYRVGHRIVDVIEAKARVAYLGAELQDKYARYGWNHEVRDVLATGLHRTDLLMRSVSGRDTARVNTMLKRCELEPLAARRFLSLSYGQKRLVLLARALIQRPDWLLLDEFYNGLDQAFRAHIGAMLDAARAQGQAWLIAAHRAADVPSGTLGLIELRRGRVHASARLRPAHLVKLSSHAQEVQAGKAGPAADPKLTAAEPSDARAQPRRGAVLLRVRGADVYVDYRAVLCDLDWQLRAGEQWAVFGANGAGKSTFLKLLHGDLLPALGGHVERGLKRGTPIREWKRRIGFISPELQTEYGVDVTVRDLVASGRHASIGLADARSAADVRCAQRWLRYFSLLSMADRRPRELSYGQLRRALFARALAGGARILLLDEPLTGLDPKQRAAMKRLLMRLIAARHTLVIAVHHAEDLPRGMTHALHLHNQRAVATDF